MSTKQALQYVRNTNGGATVADFIDDHEPIGDKLWRDLRHKLYAYEALNLRIYLTDAGNAVLDGKKK